MKKNGIAFIMLLVSFAITSKMEVYAGGIRDSGNETTVIQEQTETKQEETTSPLARTLIATEPSVKPEWVDVVPQNDTEFFFVGTSQFFDTPTNARENAREDARNQVLVYYGQVIERQAISLSTIAGSTRDTLAAYVVSEDEIRTFAQNVVSEVATLAYYTEMYLNSNNKESYIVYTLHQINRQKAESEISGFAKNISERYTASLSQLSTLKSALESYALIVKSLERNPLHRIMAYYETPTGRAGLYEYARMKISELANSVNIESIPARTIQETENLTTRINIRSSIIPATGLLDCQASIFGLSASGSGEDVIFPFKSASDDPYNLLIRNIKPGSYNVRIDILLSDLTGGIAKDTNGNFSFTVAPLNVLLDTPAAIEAGIKKAVDALAVGLPTQTVTKIGLFTMSGKDIPSELSIYLTEKVTHYAKNNQERKYRIMESDTEQEAVLSGFFTNRNNRVDVTLELSTPNRDRDGSQIFSLSVGVLEKTIGLAIEPENVNSMIVLDDVVPAALTETIHIEAKLNSNTHTYKHGDELKLTVTADRDCYFKIIHIDVDSKIKMIFPARNDNNNFLRANASHTIFDTPNSRRILCEPYGAETLVVVASPVQFPNIEREYNEDWKAATEETIVAAIAGAGQARYPITVIKPHEQYEFTKPDMTELYQAIRDDTVRQGGYFTGNATSGFYIINNVRGSYRVPTDKPDTVQFATYYLDAYTADSYRGTRTRGSGFNFSFARPQDIAQAVQTVRSSILEKGGTFTGNEQQGNFKADGIAGQYQVADLVNVTILEKPFVVPSSLIVNEVKKFFGVR